MSYKVLLTDHPWPDVDIERDGFATIGAEFLTAPSGDEATLTELANGVDAIATCWAQVTARVLNAAQPTCRIVSRMGIGLDNIDIPAATERGMLVTNVPDYCVEEVADHAIGLLLSLSRNIGFFHQRTKQGEYNLAAGPEMHRLRGMTLGLLGLGRIGGAVCDRARAFGLKVIAHTPSGNNRGHDVEMVSFDELLTRSDFLSLHAPLHEGTHHILNESSLKLCKPGLFVVNTSRGGLIDASALSTAIQEGRISGAGLDVFEPEPPDLHDPLYRNERVIVTPHAAFVSEESLRELRQRVVQQIVTCLQGGTPDNVVNR
ncbi:MAG: C-terminal binding protein [Planctomycetaceae bacterium]|nr:C-terminal binding protein [Planctomycetaceae bacterium]